MKHVSALSRVARRPALAADIEDVAKVINEALSIAGSLVDTLAGLQNLIDEKAE